MTKTRKPIKLTLLVEVTPEDVAAAFRLLNCKQTKRNLMAVYPLLMKVFSAYLIEYAEGG